jgi:hypothetical protein
MALVGSLFWNAWSDDRPRTPEQEPTKPIPTQPPVDIVNVLLGVVKPADRRKRVEIEEVHRAYVNTCKARGGEVASDESFVAQAKWFVDAAGIRTRPLYWCGVKLDQGFMYLRSHGNVLARRKPRKLFRLKASPPSRLAERRPYGKSPQERPRTTRMLQSPVALARPSPGLPVLLLFQQSSVHSRTLPWTL